MATAALLLRSQDPESARRAAKTILSKLPYYTPKSKSRLDGFLEPIGRPIGKLFSKVGRAIGKFFEAIVPGSGPWETTLIVVIIAVVAGLVARWVIRRRTTTWTANATERSLAASELDRLADEAAARGDHALAVILRFRAGIVRLDAGLRPSASRATNATIAATIPSSFPPLAGSFDAIRYGDASASEATASAAKSGWSDVLNEARVVKSSATKPPKRKRLRG